MAALLAACAAAVQAMFSGHGGARSAREQINDFDLAAYWSDFSEAAWSPHETWLLDKRQFD